VVAAISERGLALLQLALVARVLSPEAFGTYALAAVLLAGVDTFTQVGTNRLVVQRPRISRVFMGTAWSIKLLRGVLVGLVCCAAAPLYGQVTGSPGVTGVILVLSLSPVFAGLESPALVLAERHLRFVRVAVFQTGIAVVRIGVVAGLAYALGDVYALAWGQAGVALVSAVLSWFFFAPLCLPCLNRADAGEILSIGKHFVLIAIGSFATTQADNLIVGSVLGSAALGYYVLAYQISQWPIAIQMKIMGRVALPVFSRIQGNRSRQMAALDRALGVQFLTLIPFCAALLLFAPAIVEVVLGSQYAEAAPVLRALVLVALGRGVSQALSSFVIANGKVHLSSRIKTAETIGFIVTVWAGTTAGGTVGAAAGAGAAYVLGAVVRVLLAGSIGQTSPLFALRPALPALTSSLLASAAACLVARSVPYQGSIGLTVGLAAFTAVYLASVGALERHFLASILKDMGIG
jgi:O-antigen/teichoic acid export membrane protein